MLFRSARFRPLVLRCKQNGVAMRIGTNHGSLSDRIMNRFGDTPAGMVESALEFLDVCEAEGFHDVVFSMKSSNTQVAIAAYRLLAARLEARAPGEPSYPFHVGVTEAGDAEDGRIKSAIGIGALLEDGLGDTIRVSLTEDPVREVPVAREIARVAGARARAMRPDSAPGAADPRSLPFADPFAHARRPTQEQALRTSVGLLTVVGETSDRTFGDEAPVRVELDRPSALDRPAATAAELALATASLRDVACESLLVSFREDEGLAKLSLLARELASLSLDWPISLRIDVDDPRQIAVLGASLPIRPARLVARVRPASKREALEALAAAARSARTGIEWEIEADQAAIPGLVRRLVGAGAVGGAASGASPVAVSLAAGASPHAVRVLAAALADERADATPIVLRQRIGDAGVDESALIGAAVGLGSSLCDGIGDLISLEAEKDAAAVVDLAYRVLQGARLRTTRTEYISCPSCGRTLFDLEETTARIKQRTVHLSGVKIAVMGCLVNGPGEMADADFGYVGSGVGQVTLYVGRQIVERAVPEAEAPDRLVELIKRSGRWVEAEAPEASGAH